MSFTERLDFEILLKTNAKRECFGMTDKTKDMYADDTPDAVWAWSFFSPSLHLDSDLLKALN